MKHFAKSWTVVVVLLLAALACRAQPGDRPLERFARNGMVVSAQEDASRAGVEVLTRGGNAIDAAVATGFALAVTYPVAGNIGGGGFMVVRHSDGRTTTFDFRETAPAASTRDMFLDSTGTYDPALSQVGYLAAGVPGSVAGLVEAHRRFGRLSLEAVMAPAIRLAEQGFVLSHREATTLNSNRSRFEAFPSTRKYFTRSDGKPYEAGYLFVQHDLARVLKDVARHGREGFYTGRTADLIVAEMKRGKGLITLDDLKDYRPVEREPIVGSYRGYRVISMPPPSSGGIALVQLLNALETFDAAALGFNASATIHLMGEAMRRVYADRARWLGDPDHFAVPTDGLVDKAYMTARMADFNPSAASVSDSIAAGNPGTSESTETTHYSVVDHLGNAVAVTTTINGLFGNYVVVDGAGFFLNNEMDDFSAQPGVPNMYGLVGTEANAIAGGKRMLSSMTPTIVEDPQGRLFMVVGSPGGSTIITTVLQVILNVVDHGMDMPQAVAAPRIHHQWLPDELRTETNSTPRDVVEALRQRGWKVTDSVGLWGCADGILVRYGAEVAGGSPDAYRKGQPLLQGGADPRGEDFIFGY